MSNFNLICIEDDEDFRKSIAFLEIEGLSIKPFASIGAAKETIDENSILLVDYVLEKESGLEIFEVIKGFEVKPPVIIMTAYANTDMAVSAANEGVFRIIQKPVSLELLITTLSSAIDSLKADKALLPALREFNQYSEILVNDSELSLTFRNMNCQFTEKEFLIISELLRVPGKWVSREKLQKKLVKGENYSRNLLDTHLTNLRKKLETFPVKILSKRGVGIKLINEL